MFLKKLVANEQLRILVIASLREAARKSETRFDDAAVNALEDGWVVAREALK
jgi:hypothetical protein